MSDSSHNRRKDDRPPTAGDRMWSIEAQNTAVLAGWAITTLASDSMGSAGYAVIARNGGDAWAWGALGLAMIGALALITDRVWLRTIAALSVFLLYGMVAIMVALVGGLRPTVGMFGPLAIWALGSFLHRRRARRRRGHV